jgi:chromosome segregation ATPase
MTFVSTRSLIQWADLIKDGLESKASYIKSIVNKSRTEEQAAFTDFYNAVFKTVADEGRDTTPTIITKGELKEIKDNVDALRTEIETLNKQIQLRDETIQQKDREFQVLKEKLDSVADVAKIQAEVEELKTQKTKLQEQLKRIADAITV